MIMPKFRFIESVKCTAWDETPIFVTAETKEEAIEKLQEYYKTSPSQSIADCDDENIMFDDPEINLNYCERLNPEDNDNMSTIEVKIMDGTNTNIYENVPEIN